MISLNFLPRERKEILRWRQYTKKIVYGGTRIIFLLICFSASFFAVNVYLSGEINALNIFINSYEETENINQVKVMEKSFKDINSDLTKINKISEGQIYWVDVFERIAAITPSSVQIVSLQIDQAGGLTIIGKAKTREDVLEFGKRLENSSDFSDIQTPLDNLIKSDDVNFKFIGKIILDNFKVKGSAKAAEAN